MKCTQNQVRRTAWRSVAGLALASVTLLAGACSSSSSGSAGTSSAPTNVKITMIGGGAAHASILIAHDLGLDHKYGVNFQITQVASAAESEQTLISSGADAAMGTPVPAGQNLIAKGAPIVCVGSYGAGGNRVALVTNDDKIQNISDLVGKKVALTVGSDPERFMNLLLQQNNIDKKNVGYVNMGFADMAAALSTHQVDAATLIEPNLSTFLDNDKSGRVLAKGGDYIASPGCMMMPTSVVGTTKGYAIYLSMVAAMSWERTNGATSTTVVNELSKLLKIDAQQAGYALRGLVLDPRVTTWFWNDCTQSMQFQQQSNPNAPKVLTQDQLINSTLQARALKEHPELFSDIASYLQSQQVSAAELNAQPLGSSS